ncbi:Beta-hydroxylase 1, 1,B1,chy1,BCH1 [Hibiscus syriacus]|uniref:Beta-hydroxylase 1, 1,B1,chy1,BCH1 n=1 Tax=Hibiscus syriacus TaxID=106335 RepID=A0A6A2XJ50_HIBSY|nr:Beta-hydroxylase 1, 1,B1,chy1,BCH1 [Hibiscus syriacus]
MATEKRDIPEAGNGGVILAGADSWLRDNDGLVGQCRWPLHCKGLGVNEYTMINVLSAVSAEGLDDASGVFDDMVFQDSVSWNSLIAEYSANGYVSCALETFSYMRALNIHSHMIKYGFMLDDYVVSSLITTYGKCGSVDESRRVFFDVDKMTAMHLNAIARTDLEQGRNIHSLTLKSGFHQDCYVETAAIELYCKCGNIEHYACMVDRLGRVGLLEDAKRTIDEMPIEPDARIWQILLSACCLHGNFDTGRAAAGKLLELQPGNEIEPFLRVKGHGYCCQFLFPSPEADCIFQGNGRPWPLSLAFKASRQLEQKRMKKQPMGWPLKVGKKLILPATAESLRLCHHQTMIVIQFQKTATSRTALLQPFNGKKEVVHFFDLLVRSMGQNVKFIVEHVCEGDGLTVGVNWHLEWKQTPVPFTRGCSFYECSVEGEILVIKKARVIIESPLKPGGVVLAAEWFLKSPHVIMHSLTKIYDMFLAPFVNPLVASYVRVWEFMAGLFALAIRIVIYISKMLFRR